MSLIQSAKLNGRDPYAISKAYSSACRRPFDWNFPVHKNPMSYPILWNAIKRVAANASWDEKPDLFGASAVRAYPIAGIDLA